MAVPGVLDAAASDCLPLEGCFGMTFDVVGRPSGGTPFTGVAGFFSISWSYFSTLEIPLLRGRAFTGQDDGAAPGVVIINRAMARQYWSKGDSLRDRVQIGAGGPAFAGQPRQIVGVVGDTRDAGVNLDPFPTMYIPIAQMPDALTALNSQVQPLWWIVRSRVDPYGLLVPIEAALREASGGMPVAHERTMSQVEVRNTARQRFNMLILIIFGTAGLLMANHWCLWGHVLFGPAAHPGTRRTHGAGGDGIEPAQHGHRSGHDACRLRRGTRHRRRALAHSLPGQLPLWRQTLGCDRVHRYAAGSQRSCAPRSLDSGEQGDARRSDGRASTHIA